MIVSALPAKDFIREIDLLMLGTKAAVP